MAVVDYDHGEEALKVHEAFQSVAANIRTFTTVTTTTSKLPKKTCAPARSTPPFIIPCAIFPPRLPGEAPQIGLVVDNSDQFVSGSLESEMQSLVDALNAPLIQPKVVQRPLPSMSSSFTPISST
jgi:ABC-2 type transport system permease protein